jgi:hypothetical protein
MSQRELEQLFKRTGRDLDESQRARIRQLKGLERVLFEELVKKLVDSLDTAQGSIKTRRGSASINQLVDQVFNALDRSGLKDFGNRSITDLNFLLQSTSEYYRGMYAKMSAKRFKDIQSKVNATMRKRLGLGPKGERIEGGYLDLLFNSEEMRTTVKQAVSNGVTSGAPMGKLIQQLERTIVSKKGVDGALMTHFRGYIFDTYQAFDRSTNTEYAIKLELDTFIYQGGLIETSRKFCKDRDNKVFTKKEAEEWRKSCDLPRKKSDPKCPGAVIDYNPVVDLGRFNCRHRTRFISRELAEQLRPDLMP